MRSFESCALLKKNVFLQFAPTLSVHALSAPYTSLSEQNLHRFQDPASMLWWQCAVLLHLLCPPPLLPRSVLQHVLFCYSDFWLHLIPPSRWLISWAPDHLINFRTTQPPCSTGYSGHSEWSKNTVSLRAKERNAGVYRHSRKIMCCM